MRPEASRPDPTTMGDIGGVQLAQAMFPEPDSDLSFERSEDNRLPAWLPGSRLAAVKGLF